MFLALFRIVVLPLYSRPLASSCPHLLRNFRPWPVVMIQGMFTKYIGFAKSIMSALPPEEIPLELSDTHLFNKACGILVGNEQRLDEEDIRAAAETVESGFQSCSSMVKVCTEGMPVSAVREVDNSKLDVAARRGRVRYDRMCHYHLLTHPRRACYPEQDSRVFQQAELCRWLLKTDIRLAACFSIDMLDNGALNQNVNITLPGSAFSGRGGGYGATDGGGGGGRLSGNSRPHVMYDEHEATETDSCMETSPEPPHPGEMSHRFAAQVLPECQMLMNVTQR